MNRARQPDPITAALATVPTVTLVPPRTARSATDTGTGPHTTARDSTPDHNTHIALDIEVDHHQPAIEQADAAATAVEHHTASRTTPQIDVTVRIVSITNRS